MTPLGWAVLIGSLSVAAVLGFQMVKSWVQEMARRQRQAEMCEYRQCSYYRDYLQKGPANLTHSQFHEAERALDYWLRSCRDWENTERGIPQYTARMIQLYRAQVRL